MTAPNDDLSTPVTQEKARFRSPFGDDLFGRFAERAARFIGTSKFLIIQSIMVILWMSYNVTAAKLWGHRYFDKYPFILLNLAFSTQAAYAAPLILLAQGRQEERDRQALERDREQARRTLQDTEYLARELAAIRIALADVATEAELERAVERVLDATGHQRPPKKAKKPKPAEPSENEDAPDPT
jgi:uncharacterized membrane protein